MKFNYRTRFVARVGEIMYLPKIKLKRLCSGSRTPSTMVAGSLLLLHRPRRPHVSSSQDPLRRVRRTSRGRDRDPRVLRVTHYLLPTHLLDVILRIATAFRRGCSRGLASNYILRVQAPGSPNLVTGFPVVNGEWLIRWG